MPTCSWISRQAAHGLMRILAIGLSATSITSAPVSASVSAPASIPAVENPRGGSISTATTKRLSASFAFSSVGAEACSRGISDSANGTVHATEVPGCSNTSAIARVWAGPVPQQPPIMATPSARNRRAFSAK